MKRKLTFLLEILSILITSIYLVLLVGIKSEKHNDAIIFGLLNIKQTLYGMIHSTLEKYKLYFCCGPLFDIKKN
jgi:hypothetical protein